ncbi:hypothetical protein [Streptomyces bohaiensis]|uniref:hypothetical protein n=1 Tax=Streptomyces bohaiensis TaxID=1431344 RepID=UPI003B78167C
MATVDTLLVELGLDADGIAEDADRAARGVESGLGSIAALAGGVAVGGMFIAGLDSAMDIASTTTKLENQLGLTASEAEKYGSVAGDVYAAGFGGGMEDAGAAVAAVSGNLADLADVGEDEMGRLTKGVMGLVQTFDWDLNEATHAAGNLIKTGLAGDATEALDLMTAAAQRLPPAMVDELPSAMAEYSEYFGKLGATGEQTMGILVAASESPLYQMDRLGDAVKEFTLRMADTEGVAEPLEELGLEVDALQELINTGRGTEAFDQVVKALSEVEDQTEATALIFELMGGPGEDAETALLALGEAGGLAGLAMEGAAGSNAALVESMESDPAQQMEAAMRTLQMTLGEALLPVVRLASEFFAENQGLLSALAPIVLAVAAALGIAAVAQWAMNSALLASPITWIILGIVAIIAVIALIATKTTWFQTIWSTAMSAVSAAWRFVWNLLTTGFRFISNLFLTFTGPGLIIKHFGRIRSTIGSAVTWINDKIRAGIDWVVKKFGDLSELPGKVIGWMKGIGSKIADPFKSGFRSAINWIIDKWNGLSFTIPSVNIPGIGKIGGATISTPHVPRLATGGIVPSTAGGMLALLGEGGQDEAVIPLSRLDGMMRSVAGAVAQSGGSDREIVFDLRGLSDSQFQRMFAEIVRKSAGGDVVRFAKG